LALLLLCLAAMAATGAEAVFPRFNGKDLTGQKVATDRFRGKPWLIVVGFERAHARSMEQWAVEFKKLFPDETRADYYEIAAMPGNLSLMRGYIDGQMVKGTPKLARSHIMTVYAANALSKALEIKDRKVVHVFVLDSAGRIAARESGSLQPESLARVRTMISGLLQ
jgi:hypothetical protein